MNEKYHRAKLKYWGAPVPGHLKHGDDSYAAKVYGCDCRDCLPSGRRRAAKGQGMSARQREINLRANKKGKPVPPGTRHGIYAYKIYRCQCDICIGANRDRSAKQRVSWLGRATGSWAAGKDAEGLQVDVIHWPPVGHGMWECPACEDKFPHRAPKGESIGA